MGRSENKELEQAMSKVRVQKAKKSVVVTEHGVEGVVEFADGQTGTVNLPGALLHQFAGIGLLAVIGEAIGKAKDVGQAIAAFNDVAVKIESGNFSKRERKAGSVKEPSEIVRAIAEAAGWSVEKAALVYARADRSTKAAMRADHRTKAALAKLRGKEVASADRVDFGAYED